ncbi:MAG: LysM peptidoglycan-binding domain-containing protein [Gammaproteobacteria bacterium]
MFKACLSSSLRRGLVIVSVGLCACSSQPARHDQASAIARPPDRHDTEPKAAPIGSRPASDTESGKAANTPLRSAQNDDIWQRVRDGFSLAPIEGNTRVSYYEAWYAKEPHYLRLVTQRAEPYLYFIVEEIERRELPAELALLPVVESAYIPYAYSRSHAAGLWQFIPNTGRLYGLKQNWWYDGRRDVYASTLAALDYLEMLNDKFFGDWLHTLAAYNAGPSRVLRAIATNRLAGKPVDYWHLDLPQETRNYVPKLLAVKHLVQDPAHFGITLWPVADKPFLTSVELDHQIDLEVAAQLADMEAEPFQLLNPGFSRWATDPDGPHRLLLPIDRAARFKQRLAALPAHEHMRWTRHLIQSGETLTHIARRYNADVSVLQQTNALRDSRIRAGDHLLVPYDPAAQDVQRFSVANSNASSALTSLNPQRYTIQRGDSLWSIARAYDVSVDELLGWNGEISKNVIKPGDKLLIWSASEPPASRIEYSVQQGDSLYAIARRFSVTVADLRRWNKLGDGSFLYPGQAMIVYLDQAQSEGEG